ncbi:MAG: tetratricopeptide repeat protein, partial [Thermoguttaceae bacterium]
MNLLSEGILYALCLLAVIFGISRPASASAPEKKSSASLPQLLEDVPEPLVRKTPSESQRDQLEAVALFSAGRMHQHREQYADALRCYERALRLDPKSATIARAIVPVALELKHYGEAVRYALKAVELEDADPVLLRRLGTYLSDEGDWAGALSLYEKAVAAKSSGKPTAADLLLRMEMGRLYCLTGQYRKAADCFAAVLRAVDGANGDDAIDPSLAKVLLGRPGSTYQLMGECFLEANRPKEAKTVFDKAEKVTPDKALHQFNLARVL